MFNSSATAGGLFEHELNDYKSVVVSRIVHDFYDTDPKRGCYGGGGIDARFGVQPIAFALRWLPPDIPSWGADYKKALKEYFNRSMIMLCHATSLPLPGNTISLDPTVKDAWGLPAIRMTYKDHPDDIKFCHFLQDRAVEMMEGAGAKKIWKAPIEEQTFSVHLLGTCRMGNDPKTSVVDKYHRAHDVKNLFLVDGSSFVTSGRGQPTCTIQALAFRMSDHLVQFAKRGEI
jgi:choline dehydrogenase-like flavoprotein